MSKRDAWWSTFLHFQYGRRDSVERIIEWALSSYDKSHVNNTSIFLISTALAWFLTTPNRFIRDKSTKALVSLLQHRLHLVPKLLERFKNLNDIYVLERLFAVAYGCVLRNQDDLKNIKKIAKWTYDNIFKDDKPPVHILLRDYARGIIEVALRKGINLKVDKTKINPPYKSNWPKRIPPDDEIKKYKFDYNSKDFKKYFWSQNSIIYSMQPEHSTIIGMYGDFGRYEFQSALQRWDTRKVSIQQLSNLAVEMVFKDLGYNVELHGRFDRYLDYYFNRGREAHKPERIGKKYQWIAFHKILALVSDKFPLKKDFWAKEYKKYIGPWEPYVRDIDPTFLIRNDDHLKKSLSINLWKAKIQSYNVWNFEKNTLKWLKTKKDLPAPKHIIQIKDDNNQEWLILEGFIKWEEETPPEYEKYEISIRELWYWVKSYIVKKEDLDKIFKWSKKQNFWGRWMPESHEFYEVFLGEYPSSVAFENLRNNYNIWIDEIWGENRSLPSPIVVTDDIYLNEFIYDCSHDGTVTVKLPCKWLVNKLKIKQKYVDGRWFNDKGGLVCLPTKIFEENFLSALLIKKNFLCEFLKENNYGIFWILLGEKRLIGGRY
ncbi:MAG: ATP-binding protein, partial [Thermoplasmata archaeon]